MTRPRTPSIALAALLVLGGGLVAGCGEDGIYDESGPVEENPVAPPVTSNPGLSNAGTAPPLPDGEGSEGTGIVGEERSGGEDAD